MLVYQRVCRFVWDFRGKFTNKWERTCWENHDLGVMVLYWCYTVIAMEWLLHVITARESDAKPLNFLGSLSMDKPKSPTNFGDFSAVELMFVILARGKGHESKIMNDNNNMD